MKLGDIIFSWDFILSIIIGAVLFIVTPDNIPLLFLKDMFGIGISVLSIVFSVFFAALAVIIASSDDKFAIFLQEEGHYKAIIDTFKFSLLVTFGTLLYSIVFYGISSFLIETESDYYLLSICAIIYAMLFSYSIFSVLNSTLDAFKYSHYRTEYLQIIKLDPPDSSEEEEGKNK